MKKEDLTSMNSEFSEFDLQHLEERLETDPLAIGGLVDLSSEYGGEFCKFECPMLEICELLIS